MKILLFKLFIFLKNLSIKIWQFFVNFTKEILLSRLFYTLPFQLLIVNIKKNQIIMLLWVILFLVISKNIGTTIGLPYLFLEPEYMDRVNFWGIFIVGLTLGSFTMSYHITCYILDGHQFSFLGGLKHPFSKFCVNNSLVPLSFMALYLYEYYHFQNIDALEDKHDIYLKMSGLFLGYSLMNGVFWIYFYLTNKDIFKFFKVNFNVKIRRTIISRVNIMERYKSAKDNSYRVDFYFNNYFLPKRVNDHTAVERQAIFKVFKQNHFNAVFIQIIVLSVVLVFGSNNNNPVFQIPAAASVLLLMTIFLMVLGALSYWMRRWTTTVIFILVFVLNFALNHEFFKMNYEAYGMDYYTKKKPEYSLAKISEVSADSNYKKDFNNTINLLDNWRNKFPKNEKPKLVFICSSGGGLRATAWTMRTLQHVDSTLGGKLMENTILMSGASGGMVGAAYFRELCLQKNMSKNINIYAREYFENITKDNLNSVTFSWVVNDLFFRFKKFTYNKREYNEDRGYALEESLNHNTGGILDKPLSAYKEPEGKGIVPMLLLTPIIANDGRKLYISPQNMAYMCAPNIFQSRFLNQKIKGIEFLRYFEKQNSDDLRFLTALRMNATFPYMTPTVRLPSQPEMQIMDAGLIDNFGVSSAARFAFVFKTWITKNTSGVVVVSIRDTPKDRPIEDKIDVSLFEKMFMPLESIYTNQEHIQDVHNDDLLEFSQSWFPSNFIHKVEFQYVPISKSMQEIKDKLEGKIKIDPKKIVISERASLSWHLTRKEKESLYRTIYEIRNQTALRQLKFLLKINKK